MALDRKQASTSATPCLGATGPLTSVFDREWPSTAIRPRPPSDSLFGCHWSPDQCLRSRKALDRKQASTSPTLSSFPSLPRGNAPPAAPRQPLASFARVSQFRSNRRLPENQSLLRTIRQPFHLETRGIPACSARVSDPAVPTTAGLPRPRQHRPRNPSLAEIPSTLSSPRVSTFLDPIPSVHKCYEFPATWPRWLRSREFRIFHHPSPPKAARAPIHSPPLHRPNLRSKIRASPLSDMIFKTCEKVA